MLEQSSPSLTVRIAQALALLDEAAKTASASLVDLPDNPAVKRLPNSSAFTVTITEMQRLGVWNGFQHDWHAQYAYARTLIEGHRFGPLRQLLKGGGYQDASHGWRVFSAEVIRQIKAITGDLRDLVSETGVARMSSGPATSARALATAQTLRRPVRP